MALAHRLSGSLGWARADKDHPFAEDQAEHVSLMWGTGKPHMKKVARLRRHGPTKRPIMKLVVIKKDYKTCKLSKTYDTMGTPNDHNIPFLTKALSMRPCFLVFPHQLKALGSQQPR